MTDSVNPNKISDDERRRADAIRKRLQDQGMGEDEAEKVALQQAAQEVHSGEGGGKNAGGGS